jgi:AbrB family looped-hinge helix DNA binding protein
MTIVGMSKITSKGQVTLPKKVRHFLNLQRGTTVAFGLSKSGIILSRCALTVEKTPFTKTEWQKIEKLAGTKGRVYHSASEAKNHIQSL